jgi:hypothetical protein
MNAENEEYIRALQEASETLQQTQLREVAVPLDVAYWVGMTLVTTSPRYRDDLERSELNSQLVARLEEVIPPALIQHTEEHFEGDLAEIVSLAFSQRDMDFIGNATIALPSGRQILDELSFDPMDRAELDGYRNKQLRAFLTISHVFTQQGGVVNPETIEAVEAELS